MRYSDIMREATARVRDYIDDGYHVFFSNAAYSNMSFAILLTKDDVTGVAVSVRHCWEHGLHDLSLVESRVVHLTEVNYPTSWLDGSSTISETFYYCIEDHKWYATDRAEREEAVRRRRVRKARRQASDRAARTGRRLEPTDRFFAELVRRHPGFKTAKPADIEVARMSWGYSVRRRGWVGRGVEYEVRYPRVAS